MNSRYRSILIACAFIFAVAAILWLYGVRKAEPPKVAMSQAPVTIPTPPVLTATPTADASPVATPLAIPTKEEIRQKQEAQINMAYATPIAVYGKVVDESGNPIGGATVEIGIADRPLQTGSKYTETTDADGLFSLDWVRGIAFSVSATKDGYYSTEKSTGQRNVLVPGNNDLPQPSKEYPVVLVLRKQGETKPLIHTSSRQIDVPPTGQPIRIDLATGRRGQGDLEVTSWLGNASQRPFDWRYQLSVPGGGLIERNGQFEFEAPADGYQSVIEVNMPTTAKRWSSDVAKDYFAKLPDGRYARFSINFYPGQRNFIDLESFVNPQSGSPHLEYDPSKQALSR